MVTFISALVTLVGALVAMRSSGRARRGGLVVAAVGLAVTVALSPRGLALDKILARLVLPAGLVWLLLGASASIAFVRGRDLAAAGLAGLTGLYWLAGAPVVGQWLLQRIELPYRELDPLSLPRLDAAVVLGGGTREVDGRPRLDDAGDRVLLGAQLYRRGKVGRLIATGSSIPGLGDPRDLSEETAALWQSLGVPESAIVRLPQPRNTTQELQVVKAFVETSTTIETLGLVTSAWHLPRALALADRVGLEVVPLPADVRSSPEIGMELRDFIPDGDGFREVHQACWELLGRAVGR